MILLDIAPPPFSDTPSIAVGVGFFLIFTAFAIGVFVLLKSSVQVKYRLIIGTVILLIAVVGSIVSSFITAQVGRKPNGPVINKQSGIAG